MSNVKFRTRASVRWGHHWGYPPPCFVMFDDVSLCPGHQDYMGEGGRGVIFSADSCCSKDVETVVEENDISKAVKKKGLSVD